jgi:hypothetical protein
MRRPYSVRPDSASISGFSLAAKFAIVCHSIANSSQSCFDVGSGRLSGPLLTVERLRSIHIGTTLERHVMHSWDQAGRSTSGGRGLGSGWPDSSILDWRLTALSIRAAATWGSEVDLANLRSVSACRAK